MRSGSIADAELLRVRRALPRGPVDDIRADSEARWMRVRRGDYTMLMNFAHAEQTVPGEGSRTIVLATHEGVALRPDGHVTLPPLAGVLVAGVRPDDAIPTGGGHA